MRRRFGLTGLTAIALVAMATGAEAKVRTLSIFKVSEPPPTVSAGDTFQIDGKVINYGVRAQRGIVSAHLRDASDRNAPEIPLEGSDTTSRVEKGEIVPFAFDASVSQSGGLNAGTTYKVRVCVANTKGPERRSCRRAGTTTFTLAPNFTPGSRSLGDELFPQIGNGGYDASNYAIDLNYDPAENLFLEGTKTTMTATTMQNLSEFTMDFQDIPVSAVTIDGIPVDSFSQVDAEPDFSVNPEVTQPMKLVIDPAGPGILAGEEVEVEVAYQGTPVLVVDADESWEGWIPACYPSGETETCDGAFVVNEPIGAQGWFPSNNFPTDKATFDTSITVPADLEAVGIGELVSNPPNGDGTETWSWSEDDPTSTYLTTATNGNFAYTKRDITENLTGRALPQYEFIDSSATPSEKAAIETSLGRTEEMTNFLSDRFGPYPYDSGGAVADKAAGVGYALEVATKSHYAGNFSTGAPSVNQSTLVHEIAHQWMGNAVTLENWNDIWWQEGWAQWVSWSWNFKDGASAKSPGEQWSENYASGPATKWDTIPTVLNNDPADLFAFFPTYIRGAMTFQGYREIVGSPKFFEFARELQQRFAYGNVSSEDVVDLMLETSGFTGDDLALLEDYFDQWLYQAGKPTITANDFTGGRPSASAAELDERRLDLIRTGDELEGAADRPRLGQASREHGGDVGAGDLSALDLRRDLDPALRLGVGQSAGPDDRVIQAGL